MLAGQGHTFTPSALGIATAALLAWKEPLAGFSHALTESELRSAILLAMLAFVAYPVLPPGNIDPWGLVEPRAAWITVLLIAALGFTNYILLKLYGERGKFTGFLGGLVNSTVTVAELTQRAGAAAGHLTDVTFRGVILATAAMLIRNAIILGLLAPLVLLSTAVPLALMLAGAAIVVLWHRRHLQNVFSNAAPDSNTEANQPAPTLPTLESPFSLTAAFKFGFIFLALRGSPARWQSGALASWLHRRERSRRCRLQR